MSAALMISLAGEPWNIQHNLSCAHTYTHIQTNITINSHAHTNMHIRTTIYTQHTHTAPFRGIGALTNNQLPHVVEMQRYTFWVYRYITSSVSQYSDILHDMA